MNALDGVGDATLGEWEEEGHHGVFHVRRRLSEAEQDAFEIWQVRDIRGTEEEVERLRRLLAFAPHLAPVLRGIA